MTSPIRFDNQVVLVTGSGRGLGRAYALRLAERGATVIVHDAGVGQDGAGCETAIADAVVTEIQNRGGDAVAAYQNLDSAAGCHDLIDEVTATFGRLDGVVNNAGIVQFTAMEDLNPDSFDRVFSIGALASLWITQAVLPWMERQAYGRIVYTVSGHGLRPSREPNELAAYGMSKGAVFGLMNMLAGSFQGKDIHVNCISPVAATRVLRRTVEAGTFTPDQIAPGVLFLVSRSCEISGTVLSAANGRFSVLSPGASNGVDFGREAVQPEDIRRRWSEIA